MLFWLAPLLLAVIAGLATLHWRLATTMIRYKGKPLPPMSGSLPVLFNFLTFYAASKSDRIYALLLSEHRKNGPLWTFTGPMARQCNLMINDPELLQELMTNQRSRQTLVRGPEFRNIMAELLGNGIFNTEEHWEEQRKAMSKMFKVRSLMQYQEEAFNAHGLKLVAHFSALAPGATVDLQELFMRLTLDTGMHIFYGLPQSNSVENGTTEYSKAFNKAQRASDLRHLFFFFRYAPWLQIERDLREAMSVLDDFFYRTIADRRADPLLHEKSDLLSLYIKDEANYSDRYIRDIMANILIAARDTVSQSLSWTMYYLASQPEVQIRAIEEIRSVWGDDLQLQPSFDDLRKQAYLQAVINESLRLAPPVPWESLDTSEEVSLQGGNLVIPKGVKVNYAPLVLGTDPAYWKDAEKFVPERWLDEGAIQHHGKPPFIPFNLGRRKCLGDVLAYLEMKVVLSLLLPRFEFRVAEGFTPTRVTAITMMCKEGMKMQVFPRK